MDSETSRFNPSNVSSIPAKFRLVTFSHSLPVKLDSNNFLLWRQQAMSTIRGHRLAEFILNPNSAPEKCLADRSINPEFLDWDQQDQLLVSWLLGSVSQDILSHLIGCVTSYEIWQKIDSLFSSNTQANVMRYKMELNSLKKGGMGMSKYLLKVKGLIDALGYAGYIVSVNDHIMYIFSGLGSEFDPFVMIVNSKIGKLDAYTVSEIQSLLLTLEKRVESLSVNFATNNNNNAKNNGVGTNPGSGHLTNNCGVYNTRGTEERDRFLIKKWTKL